MSKFLRIVMLRLRSAPGGIKHPNDLNVLTADIPVVVSSKKLIWIIGRISRHVYER